MSATRRIIWLWAEHAPIATDDDLYFSAIPVPKVGTHWTKVVGGLDRNAGRFRTEIGNKAPTADKQRWGIEFHLNTGGSYNPGKHQLYVFNVDGTINQPKTDQANAAHQAMKSA